MRPLDIFVVAGEESGDLLGAAMMRALSVATNGAVGFRGVGGHRMEEAGLVPLFPMEDLTAMGLGAVLGKLPTILRRMRETVDSVAANPPDVLVLIDAPDFTHRVAKRIRKRLPDLPIVKYVAPTVWVWREGRARAMRGSIDHVLALFPFEPEVMHRLGGPETSYVGHPLLNQIETLRPGPAEAERRRAAPPILLVLPGSRRQELARLTHIFGETVGRLAEAGRRFELVLPTLPRLEQELRERTADWAVRPEIVVGEAARHAAFRSAYAALAASGTVTLELALSGVPMVAAYRAAGWEARLIRPLVKVPSVILPNIVIGESVVPEFIQEDCRADRLAAALEPLLQEGPAREAQLAGFARLDALMSTDGEKAAERAARVVLAMAEKGRAASAAAP